MVGLAQVNLNTRSTLPSQFVCQRSRDLSLTADVGVVIAADYSDADAASTSSSRKSSRARKT